MGVNHASEPGAALRISPFDQADPALAGVSLRAETEPMPRFDHDPASTGRARGLRRALTRYEVRLWMRLRGSQLGVAFRKQHPIGPCIVDFAAPSVHLVVEIDGGQHGAPDGLAADRKRDAFLSSKGWEVMRFWNSDLFDNEDGVVETIWRRVQERSRSS